MKNTLIKLLVRLTGASRELFELLVPILRDSASRLLTQLAPIAIEVVRGLADSPQSGAKKREAAITQIQSLAAAEGLRAGSSVVNLALELAVANLKTK